MTAALNVPKQRIQSIDIFRGLIMLIMALDHVRDFFHFAAFTDSPTNLATTTPFLFFTRYITHFCAPAFLFLSGTSAFLAGQRRTKKQLSAFLIKRGCWLVLVEITVITLTWTFNPLYNVFILQVIWAIGWSMIILGLLVRTSITTITIIGCILVFGHNILDYVTLPRQGTESVLWNVFFTSNFIFYQLNKTHLILDAYAILPWTGLMLLGYSFGQLYRTGYDAARRRSILLTFGFAFLALFIVLRIINKYGDPAPWSRQKDNLFSFLSFINVTKYPVSLEYSCMTLGIALLAIALLEHVHNRFTGFASTYGRVPFFYYLCHLFLIHIICVILFFSSGYGWKDVVDPNIPFLFRPLHFGFNLWVLYLIWVTVILLLYKPCKWFDNYRRTHHQWWLSYI
jgi:uncharacterized membrane protein